MSNQSQYVKALEAQSKLDAGDAPVVSVGLHSEHFTSAELACRHCGLNGCKQSLVDALEAFRAAVGKPVIVNDAYRCPIHNAEVGGAPKSQHLLGLAADIRVTGMTAGQLEAYARTIPAIKGIGRAPHQGYIHVDVRESPTIVAWCYDWDGKTIPYYTTPDAVISA